VGSILVKPTFEDFTESIGIKPPSDFVAVIPSRYPVGIKKKFKDERDSGHFEERHFIF
jgi:hypothetical protein